jgi:hypothetical protein
MGDMWTRFAEINRVSGPINARLLFQSIMASVFAVRAGLQDARLGKPPISGLSFQMRPIASSGSGTVPATLDCA